METTEQWKPLVVYNANITILNDYSSMYEISNQGRIRNIKRNTYLKHHIHDGYCKVSLSMNSKTNPFFLHRVVASTFHPNPDKKCIVNHIDRNRSNNNSDNLEWCTTQENNAHARRTGFNIYTRHVTRCNLDRTNPIEYMSVKEAAEECNTNTTSIIEACKGNIKHAGYLWAYTNITAKFDATSRCEAITGYLNYSVYADGRVYSMGTKRFLKQSMTQGYYSVNLHPSAKKFLVHRLVAHAFIPNPDNKPIINHKDRNRANNNYSNLEWCNQQENMAHANNKVAYQYGEDGKLIKKYDSITEAALAVGSSESNISAALNNSKYISTAWGFIWSYEPRQYTPEELKSAFTILKSTIRGVIQMDMDYNAITTYDSARIAATTLDIDPSGIAKVCRGKCKSLGGFRWMYMDDSSEIVRLTPDQVDDIKDKYSNGMTIQELAIEYDRHKGSIKRYIKGVIIEKH